MALTGEMNLIYYLFMSSVDEINEQWANIVPSESDKGLRLFWMTKRFDDSKTAAFVALSV